MKGITAFANFCISLVFLLTLLFFSIFYFPSAFQLASKKIANFFDYELEMEITSMSLKSPKKHILYLDFVKIKPLSRDEWSFEANNLNLDLDLLRSISDLNFYVNHVGFDQGSLYIPGLDKSGKSLDYLKVLNKVDSLSLNNLNIFSLKDEDIRFILSEVSFKTLDRKKEYVLKLKLNEEGLIYIKGDLRLNPLKAFEANVDFLADNLDFNNPEVNYLCSFCSYIGPINADGSFIYVDNNFISIESNFQSRILKGKLNYTQNPSKDLTIIFDFINISSGGKNNSSFLKYVKESVRLPISIKVDELFIDNKYRGRWSFDYLNSSSIKLTNIKGNYGLWEVLSQKKGSTIEFKEKQDTWNSSFNGELVTQNIADGLEELGYSSNLSSNSTNLDLNISWDGLLDGLSFNQIKGDIIFSTKNLIFSELDEELKVKSNYLRFISIFNLTDTFEKVTNLDFTKLLSSGFGVDSVTGGFSLEKSSIKINRVVLFKSGSSEIRWTGFALRDSKGNFDELEFQVLTTLPINEYLPAYALVLGGPVTAGAFYIAGKLFEDKIDKIGTGKWLVNGNIEDPVVEFIGWNN
tara:strand:+ start:11706 stop:13439 length:1734 start_codon:yes stop_codon:yes gene_type:complete